MEAVRVGVVEEHGIFRRGIVACLGEDPSLEVVFEAADADAAPELDVAVVDSRAAARHSLSCPLVVCGERSTLTITDNAVHAILPRSSLTPEQLVATVRAAAVGLRVNPSGGRRDEATAWLDNRSVEVLRMLAQGADTREISESLRYSERTIKGLIHDIERKFDARTRAQAVAEGIRSGLI
jgi:DNA-binding NarL/FixJ family response regulator